MSESDASTNWTFYRFYLFVTGKAEEKHLPKMFRSLMTEHSCHFVVEKRIGQRDPITSPERQKRLGMAGTKQRIPTRDESEIGLPARRILSRDDNAYVLLVDDMEDKRAEIIGGVFERYRKAGDTLLTDSQKRRFAVHFLVRMLEAYYLVDSKAVNAALGTGLVDFVGDVEEIRNPKSDLKQSYPAFDEIEDGGRILAKLDAEHVLSRKDTCASLRSLFGWCVDRMNGKATSKYRLTDGIRSAVTDHQIRQ
jgi:hypothetical protein